jgi:hypothetical protein
MTDTPPTKRPPGRPPVPRQSGKILFAIVTIICVVIVGGYVAVASSQRELTDEQHDEIPSSVRSTPGGYRSYSYWHSGYHGGK